MTCIRLARQRPKRARQRECHNSMRCIQCRFAQSGISKRSSKALPSVRRIYAASGRQFEVVGAIARAMTNEVPEKTTLGERWCFFRDSLLKGRQAKLALMPQVVPRVKRNGKELDKTEVEQWYEGTRESPPQPTMRQSN
jgi:hypothetical protein